jgi:Spy/CpxP family protein refolding chaperone
MKPQTAVSLSLLSIGLALTAGTSLAQDAANAPAPTTPPAAPSDGSQAAPTPAPEHRGRRGGFVLEELTQKLTLTPDQQKQVGDLIKSSREQMKALHEDDSMSEDDKRAKMKEITSTTRSQIRALLTPAQQAIFDTLPTRGQRPPPPPAGAAPGENPPPPPADSAPPASPAPTSPPSSN